MKKLAARLKADLYFILCNKAYFAFLLVPVLIILDSPSDLYMHLSGDNGGSVYYHYFHSMSFGGLFGPYLIPMLCALPYAASFCEERSSGFWRTSIARGSWKRYFLSRFTLSVLSGGLVFALGMIVFWSVLSFGLPLFSRDDLEFLNGFFYGKIVHSVPVMYVVVVVVYSFFSGCIYAAFAAAVSSFTTSRSAVIAAPFVLEFTWVRVCVLTGLENQYRLDQWLKMRTTCGGQIGAEEVTFLVCALCTTLIVLMCGIAFCRQGKKVLLNA